MDLGLLQDCIRLDQREHAAALRRPRYPTSFTVRLIPGIYRQIPLPVGIDEEKAIELVQGYAVEKGLSCAILYPRLTSLWIAGDGTIAHQSHEPQITIAKGKVTIGESGEVGVTRVRG